MQIKDEGEIQRYNIFHTTCKVQEGKCLLIIDSGSCTNCVSSYLVDTLNLPTTKHPHPYHLQWFNDHGDTKVTKQAKVNFSIGKYVDEVVCDVVPMTAAHILLGRPWEYDHDATHEGRSNKYRIVHCNKSFTLVPMLPHDVFEMQKKMKEKRQKESGEMKKPNESANEEKKSAKEKKEKEKETEKKSGKTKIGGSVFVTKSDVDWAVTCHKPIYILLSQDFLSNHHY